MLQLGRPNYRALSTKSQLTAATNATFLPREQIKLRRLDDNQMSALEDDLMTLAKTDVLDQTADDDLYSAASNGLSVHFQTFARFSKIRHP